MGRRVKTPTVIQMEAVECGAAALTIVLGAFGRIVSLEEMRLACGVSRDGSRANNIVRAAQQYGLVTKGYRREPEQLRDMPMPQIIHWNFNHFLVLEGFHKNRVYLNDPASGPRTVDFEEFERSFTGITLTFEKGDDFKPGGAKRSLISALRRRAAGLKSGLLMVIATGLLLVIPGLVLPAVTGIFIDDIFIKRMTDWIWPVLLTIGGAVLVQALLTWMQEYYLLRLGTSLALRESAKFFLHVLRLPMDFFNQRYGGEVGSRVGINDKIATVLSEQLARNVVNVVMVVFYAGIMLFYSLPLTVMALCLTSLNILVLKMITRQRIDRSQRMVMKSSRLTGISMGGLQSIETLKAAGRESDFFTKWSGAQAEYMNAMQELSRLSLTFGQLPTLVSALNEVLILLIGGLLIMNGSMTIGSLVAFKLLIPNLLGPFSQLVQLTTTIQELEGDVNRLDDVFNYPVDEEVCLNREPGDFRVADIKLSGGLVMNDIQFGYSRLDPPLVTDFSLRLEPGRRIALVGATGSGKSTIAKLVSGLYHPWSGELLFDGRAIRDIPPAVFFNSVALVDQEIFLFEGTVKENLTLWDDAIPMEDLVAATRDACIHDEISTRPEGYMSHVAEQGVNFSGGQRQRLEIARALVNNPTVLIMDEATSALDPVTEKKIDRNLRRRGCSCLIVAHRLSTIRDCDEIIVMANGNIVQRGCHEEMIDVDGPYARLIQSIDEVRV